MATPAAAVEKITWVEAFASLVEGTLSVDEKVFKETVKLIVDKALSGGRLKDTDFEPKIKAFYSEYLLECVEGKYNNLFKTAFMKALTKGTEYPFSPDEQDFMTNRAIPGAFKAIKKPYITEDPIKMKWLVKYFHAFMKHETMAEFLEAQKGMDKEKKTRISGMSAEVGTEWYNAWKAGKVTDAGVLCMHQVLANPELIKAVEGYLKIRDVYPEEKKAEAISSTATFMAKFINTNIKKDEIGILIEFPEK